MHGTAVTKNTIFFKFRFWGSLQPDKSSQLLGAPVVLTNFLLMGKDIQFRHKATPPPFQFIVQIVDSEETLTLTVEHVNNFVTVGTLLHREMRYVFVIS
jgi:hypothetical protein